MGGESKVSVAHFPDRVRKVRHSKKKFLDNTLASVDELNDVLHCTPLWRKFGLVVFQKEVGGDNGSDCAS